MSSCFFPPFKACLTMCPEKGYMEFVEWAFYCCKLVCDLSAEVLLSLSSEVAWLTTCPAKKKKASHSIEQTDKSSGGQQGQGSDDDGLGKNVCTFSFLSFYWRETNGRSCCFFFFFERTRRMRPVALETPPNGLLPAFNRTAHEHTKLGPS